MENQKNLFDKIIQARGKLIFFENFDLLTGSVNFNSLKETKQLYREIFCKFNSQPNTTKF